MSLPLLIRLQSLTVMALFHAMQEENIDLPHNLANLLELSEDYLTPEGLFIKQDLIRNGIITAKDADDLYNRYFKPIALITASN